MDELFDLFDDDEVIEEMAEKPKKKKEKEAVKAKDKTYKFPFGMYINGSLAEIDHIFTENKEYTAEEITKAMLEHKHYEFAGNVVYDHIEKDNVLVPTFQQHKKG